MISVIIPAHNAAKWLTACLTSVYSSRGVRFEVIVVDDASTDTSADIAATFPCTIVRLKENIMAAACRNLGAALANGDILVFFDADQVMRDSTLAQYAAAFARAPTHAAIVGAFGALTPAAGFFSKLKNYQHHYVHTTSKREACTLASGLMAVRRTVFEELGGFETPFGSASIEDIALGYKLKRHGYRILFLPEIQVDHLKEYSLRTLLMSEIFARAIPWTRLLLRERLWKNDLNTRNSNVLSVMLSWVMPLAIATGIATGNALTPVFPVALLYLLNAGLLRGVSEILGYRFLLGTLVYLPVWYVCQGAGFMAGLFLHLQGRELSVAKPTACVASSLPGIRSTARAAERSTGTAAEGREDTRGRITARAIN